MRGNQRWLRGGILVVVVLVAFVLTLPITLTPGVRTRLTDALSDRFDSEVQIEVLHISLLPRLQVKGERVVLRYKGRTDVPPLIQVASFSAEANIFGLVTRPLRLSHIAIDGLEINVPPGGMRNSSDGEPDDTGGKVEQANIQGDGERANSQSESEERSASDGSPLVIDDLLSENAVFRMLRSDASKPPRVWEIARLSMQRAGSNEPWPFEAALTNPTPPGEIRTRGTFGPWNRGEPSQTPLNATYEFSNADLGAFDGISGILKSTGAFAGVLQRIEVDGEANVPAFALSDVGNAIPLTTRFHATVDGTNGNTWLRPVDATLGESPILATGGVIERDGEDGRTVELDVVMNEARIEDVLRLAMKSATPFMTGGLMLKTKLLLPPGDRGAVEKLQLDGTFTLASARFTTGTVQAKLNELSHKARGEGEPEEAPDRVVSDFTGTFVMKDGVIRFSNLTFAIPGANVDLAGGYTVRSEALDFRGTVRLDAKLSELTTGMKSYLLKLVDPLVRRKDVTVIPITIKGTAAKPDFGVDLKRAFTPGG